MDDQKNAEAKLKREIREDAWAYFDRHAEQRLKTFNFFVLLSAAIITGFVTIGKAGSFADGWPLGFLLTATSFIFWKLEERNRELVKHSEETLKLLEDELPFPDGPDGLPHPFKLFRREEALSERRKVDGSSLARSRFSYTRCFHWTFVLFGTIGLLAGIGGGLVALVRAVR